MGRALKVVNSANIVDKYVGETGKNIEKVFAEARVPKQTTACVRPVKGEGERKRERERECTQARKQESKKGRREGREEKEKGTEKKAKKAKKEKGIKERQKIKRRKDRK